jgi:hypothetical protein
MPAIDFASFGVNVIAFASVVGWVCTGVLMLLNEPSAGSQDVSHNVQLCQGFVHLRDGRVGSRVSMML